MSQLALSASFEYQCYGQIYVGHYKYVYSYSADIDFRRQILTSKPRKQDSLNQYRFNVSPAVTDVGPTLNRHWLNVSCLLGSRYPRCKCWPNSCPMLSPPSATLAQHWPIVGSRYHVFRRYPPKYVCARVEGPQIFTCPQVHL